jgi:hypothetical protein
MMIAILFLVFCLDGAIERGEAFEELGDCALGGEGQGINGKRLRFLLRRENGVGDRLDLVLLRVREEKSKNKQTKNEKKKSKQTNKQTNKKTAFVSQAIRAYACGCCDAFDDVQNLLTLLECDARLSNALNGKPEQ